MKNALRLLPLVLIIIMLIPLPLFSSTLNLQDAFAVSLDDQIVGQHMPNKISKIIQSIEFAAKLPAKQANITGQVVVEIVQNGDVIATSSVNISDLLSTERYRRLNATFDDTAYVQPKNYDIVFSYEGEGSLIIKSTSESKRAGNMFVGTYERKNYDLVLELQWKPPPTSTIKVQAKELTDLSKTINGIYVQVVKGTEKIADGYTPLELTVTTGETYQISVADFGDFAFNKWQDTSSNDRTRTILVSKDVALVALYESKKEDTDNEYKCTTNCIPAGSNKLTVNSQLRDGSKITGYMAQLRVGGEIIESKFTPAIFTLEPGKEYKLVMYWTGDTFFRHYTDGVLTRYHTVIAKSSGEVLTAVYEHIPSWQQAKLNIIAETADGQQIGGVSGSDSDGTLQAEPGVWMELKPSGSQSPYTGAFSGSSSLPFILAKGQSYAVTVYSYPPYQFSHWKDTGSENPVRSFSMSGDISATAIYDVVSTTASTDQIAQNSDIPEWYDVGD